MTQEQDGEGRTSAVWLVNGMLLLLIGLAIGLGPIRAGLGGFEQPPHVNADADATVIAPVTAASAPAALPASGPALGAASGAVSGPASAASESASSAWPSASDPASGPVPVLAPVESASHAHAAASVAAHASGAEAGGASIAAVPGVVTFYFARGSADVAQGAQQALADIVRGVAAGRRAIVSGYHDATGDATANAELARRRAQGVRDTLQSLGIGEDKIELRKPQTTTGSGDDAQARRVEVTLQ